MVLTRLAVIDENPFHLIGAFPGPVSYYNATKNQLMMNQPDTPYEGGYYEVVGGVLASVGM